MAARPNKAIAGRDPFADLLFSPRAAFIWDHTTRAITWMNAAARSKFGLDAEELQARLAGARRLAQCFDAANGNGKTSGTVKFKAGRHPAISCSFEVIELAGGHKGLIVSEAAGAQEPANVVRLPAPPKKKTVAKPSGKQPAAQTKRQQAPSKPTRPPASSRPRSCAPLKLSAGRFAGWRGRNSVAPAPRPRRVPRDAARQSQPGRRADMQGRPGPALLRLRSRALSRRDFAVSPDRKAALSTLAGANPAVGKAGREWSCRLRSKPFFAA